MGTLVGLQLSLIFLGISLGLVIDVILCCIWVRKIFEIATLILALYFSYGMYVAFGSAEGVVGLLPRGQIIMLCSLASLGAVVFYSPMLWFKNPDRPLGSKHLADVSWKINS